MKIKRKLMFLMLTFVLFGVLLPSPQSVEAKSSVQTVTLGKWISVYKEGASYSTSDSSIAYVNNKGRVTGKKIGTAVITIKKDGKSSKISIRVRKNQKKKSITVCSDEILIKKQEVTFEKQVITDTNSDEGTNSDGDTNLVEDTNPDGDTNLVEDTNSKEGLDTEKDAGENTNIEENANTDGNRTEAMNPDAESNESVQNFEINYIAKITIKNAAKKAASNVILYAKVGDNNLTFDFGKIEAGKTKNMTFTGRLEAGLPEEQLETAILEPAKLEVKSNQMIHKYSYEDETMELFYGTKDKTKPVFSGFIEKNSYNGSIPYQIVYSDKAENYNFKKYISVEDDRDTKVRIVVDTSQVNFNKTGTYKVIYRATDSAGNTAKTYAKIGVRVAKKLDTYCDKILSRIIKPSWSDTKKVNAIYRYTRNLISYTGHSDKSNWEKAAVDGFNCGLGDCFTYYAVARALLTRAGIPNIEVTRVAGYGHHWWNMVYVQGGFYHFDACPRRGGGNFCMVTDRQLKAYSSRHGNSHIWAYKKKPKSGTKVLSRIF